MSVFEGYQLDECTLVDDHGIRWMKQGLPWKDFLRTRFKLRRSHPTALEYLQRYADEFPWAGFCLEHGQVSQTESYRTVRDRVDRRGFMEEGQCYVNSMSILRRWRRKRPKWVADYAVSYVEGLALDPTGVFLHSWIDVAGNAYDMTFQRASMTSYFGVRFDPVWVDKTMERIGRYGLFHWWDRSSSHLLNEFQCAA
jgi:hypothetical protein